LNQKQLFKSHTHNPPHSG